MPEPDPRLLAGRYRLGAVLAQREGRSVFEGFVADSGERVIVKMLSPQIVSDARACASFELGTKLAQGFQHVSLPKVFAFVRDDAGNMYQVREYFDAGSLQARVRAGWRADRRQAHQLLKGLLEVLAYLQSQTPAIFHRNIHPSNLMFRDASPVLVDFELAAPMGADAALTPLVVNYGYTAPEQLSGQTKLSSDLYSVGMSVLYALTGAEPNALPKHEGRLALAELLRDLEPATAHVLSQLVEPDFRRRYQSAAAASQDLRGIGPFQARQIESKRPAFWNRSLALVGPRWLRITALLVFGMLAGYTLLVRWMQETQAEIRSVRGAGKPPPH